MINARQLAVGSLFALAACNLGTDLPDRLTYGLILFTTKVRADSTFSTRPAGFFFQSRQQGLPTSRPTADECLLRPYTPPTGPGFNPGNTVDAGDTIFFQVSGTTTPMVPTQGLGVSYLPSDTAGVIFTPGDQATFTIPGAPGGFPQASISVRTATPFTFAGIDTAPPIGQGVNLAWSPAGDDSSKMVISLQYSVLGDGGSALNEQILCALIDDGSYLIDPRLVSGWRESAGGQRRVQASRWRIALVDLGDAQLFAQSTFDYQTTEFP